MPSAQSNEKPSGENPDRESRKLRKTRQGVIVSDKMDKSIVVRVERTMRHPLYKKVIRRSRNYMAHDQENTGKIGDKVRIMECRPMSRHKRWRLVEVMERAEG